MIERELASRGISAGTIEQHEIQQRQQVIVEQDGRVAACSYCELPAVAEGWGWWYILWGVLPIFPRFVRYCREHRPVVPEGNPEATEDKGLQED
jgi:hypothetical protein